MAVITNEFPEHRQIRALRSQSSVFQSSVTQRMRPQHGTDRVEQVLIFATIAFLPLQEYIPAVGGFSIPYLLFAAQAACVISKRPKCFAKTWLHPLFLAIYVFLSICYLMELSRPYSYHGEIFQMFQAFVGAIFLASLCRDRKALRIAMYGYIASGLIFAVNLLLNSYGALSGATAVNFGEAERLRAQIFEENPLQYNLNGMAFFTAQATGVAFALALTARSAWSRNSLLAVVLASFIATFLPMSRSGIGIVIAVCATVLLRYGINRSKSLFIAILVGATVVIFVPQAVWSRLVFSTEVDQFGRMEGRAGVYTAFFHHLPEFIMTGVGAANFLYAWGPQSLYGNGRGGVIGAHNVFFQMTIFWGLPALFGLFGIIYQAYRCLPGRYGNDGLAIGVLVVVVSLLFWSLTVHNLYAKEFSLGVGLLVASDRWIWPKQILRLQPQRRRRGSAAWGSDSIRRSAHGLSPR